MPRLSRAQDAARRTINDAVVSGLTPEALGRRVMSALLSAIPCDGYRLFAVDPATLLINRLLASSDTDGWARAEWLRDVYLRSGEIGYIELPVLMKSGLTAVAIHETQEASWGYPQELLAKLDPARHRYLFHELRSPVGGTILATFPADRRWVAALQAYRRDPSAPFKSGDIAFVRLVAPTIGKGIAAAIAREKAMTASKVNEDPERTSGVIVIAGNGRPSLVTPAGEMWIERIEEAGKEPDSPIPTAVWAAIAKMRGNNESSASVIVPTTSGSVRVEVSPAGSDGSVAVVLAPERTPVPTEAPHDWPLTAGERRVVDLVLRGFPNSRIGEELFISVNTVEWHLRSSYEKLGVRSRLELLARLFHEHAPSALFATDAD